MKITDKFNNRIEATAARLMKIIGSPISIVLHLIIIAASFLLVLLGASWELLLLIQTTVLSIYAIFLELFNLLATNKVAGDET